MYVDTINTNHRDIATTGIHKEYIYQFSEDNIEYYVQNTLLWDWDENPYLIPNWAIFI